MYGYNNISIFYMNGVDSNVFIILIFRMISYRHYEKTG